MLAFLIHTLFSFILEKSHFMLHVSISSYINAWSKLHLGIKNNNISQIMAIYTYTLNVPHTYTAHTQHHIYTYKRKTWVTCHREVFVELFICMHYYYSIFFSSRERKHFTTFTWVVYYLNATKRLHIFTFSSPPPSLSYLYKAFSRWESFHHTLFLFNIYHFHVGLKTRTFSVWE